jgi:hypothetical protein
MIFASIYYKGSFKQGNSIGNEEDGRKNEKKENMYWESSILFNK